MPVTIIGEHPLTRNAQGNLSVRIGTLFPDDNVLVTIPGVHATQKYEYLKICNTRRLADGLPALTEDGELALFQNSVDLIFENGLFFIRPNPDDMPLAFRADDILQELVSKQNVKFLHTLNPVVRQAIKQRGECWRINPMPQTTDEMLQMIRAAHAAINGRTIYYYSWVTGTRWLTCQEFEMLRKLPGAELLAHLVEIQTFANRHNAFGYPEIDFFSANSDFTAAIFNAIDFSKVGTEGIHGVHQQLASRFTTAVPTDLWVDCHESLEWRTHMFAALIGLHDEVVTEESLLGLGAEFFLQVEWIPGARFEQGEVIFDSIYDEIEGRPDDVNLCRLCENKVKGFIFNFIREYGHIESINIGRVAASLSRRKPGTGRREVYIAEVKRENDPQPVLRMIRMLKWGIREHLDEGQDLLRAIMDAEEYADYTFDRRFGCLQLGMNLPDHVTLHKVSEQYRGTNLFFTNYQIWSGYLERDYVPGIATDKIPLSRYQNQQYALKFASLLGSAAATNLVAGRVDMNQKVLFDDGDEVIVEDHAGMPQSIVVSEHTGTFNDYLMPLENRAAEYARPINRRRNMVPYPTALAESYCEAFYNRLCMIQNRYRERKRAFDTLFKHRPRNDRGSFAFRWEKVLDRLNSCDPKQVVEIIRHHSIPTI